MNPPPDATDPILDLPIMSAGDALVMRLAPGPTGRTLTWRDIMHAADLIAQRARRRGYSSVYGIPTGGVPVAVIVAERLGVPLVEHPGLGTLVVDDLIDSGRTLRPYVEAGFDVDAMFRKPHSPATICPDAVMAHTWLRFPWEHEQGEPIDAVLRLLQYIGEDPTREGLVDTPKRVVKALAELTKGYRDDVPAILSTTFDVEHSGELVIAARLPFASLCEHHMLPFTGTATLAYLPGSRVVGLSKLGRLLDAFACRLQVQERLTMQLADAMMVHLDASGAAAIVEGRHGCMAHRGIRKDAPFITSSYLGTLTDDVMRRGEVAAAHRS